MYVSVLNSNEASLTWASTFVWMPPLHSIVTRYVFCPLNVPEDKSNTVLMCYIWLWAASNGAIICSPDASDALAILRRLSVCECAIVSRGLHHGHNHCHSQKLHSSCGTLVFTSMEPASQRRIPLQDLVVRRLHRLLAEIIILVVGCPHRFAACDCVLQWYNYHPAKDGTRTCHRSRQTIHSSQALIIGRKGILLVVRAYLGTLTYRSSHFYL